VGANKLSESLARSWWVFDLIRCCPATLRKGRGVISHGLSRDAQPAYCLRAGKPDEPTSAPNTASGLETGWLNNGVKLSLLNFRARCDAPRARGNGLGWLPVFPSRPKAPNLVRKMRAIQATVNPQRVCCLQPT